MDNDNWNELQFLSWTEFKQMAPSILQLEVTRLGKVMHDQIDDTDFHNSLVRARFSLRQFIGGIQHAESTARPRSDVYQATLLLDGSLSQIDGLGNAVTRGVDGIRHLAIFCMHQVHDLAARRDVDFAGAWIALLGEPWVEIIRCGWHDEVWGGVLGGSRGNDSRI